MNFLKFKSFVFLALALNIFSNGLEGTHGYFPTGYGARSQGMGGTAAANPQDSLVIATNPAGISFLENRFDAGFLLFNPVRGYSYSEPSKHHVHSQRDLFVVPAFSILKHCSNCDTFGLALYGRGGMNTTYPSDNPVFGFGVTEQILGLDYCQMLLAPTYSRALSKCHSVAVSLLYGVQRIRMRGLQGFAYFSSSPKHITNHGYNYAQGWGGRIGYMGEIFSHVKIGVAYASKVYMSKFDKYRGMLAEKGKLDIPAELSAGISWQPSAAFTAAFDYAYIFYKDVKALGNPIQLIAPGNLGTSHGAGFGWDNISVYKAGVNYVFNACWEVRAGYSYGDIPYSSSQVDPNIVAPAVTNHHLSVGTTFHASCRNALDCAFVYALPSSRTGTSLFGLETIKEKMHQYSLTINWAHLY